MDMDNVYLSIYLPINLLDRASRESWGFMGYMAFGYVEVSENDVDDLGIWAPF